MQQDFLDSTSSAAQAGLKTLSQLIHHHHGLIGKQTLVTIAKGMMSLDQPAATTTPTVDLDAVRESCSRSMQHEEFYETYWVQGPDAGSSFRWIEEIWMGDDVAVCRTTPPDLDEDARAHAEARADLLRAGRLVAALYAASLLFYLAAVFLTLMVVYILGELIEPWVGAALVGGSVMIAAVIVALRWALALMVFSLSLAAL